jgi:hypothetical protein
MTHTAMIDAHPQGSGDLDREALAACLEATTECAQTCTACADACLGEDAVADLVTCIRTDLDCADVCAATASVLTRQGGGRVTMLRDLLTACVSACRTCAEECEKHAGMHGHCRLCAEACRRCEQACQRLLGALG